MTFRLAFRLGAVGGRGGEISCCILHTSRQVVINVQQFLSMELEFAFEKQKMFPVLWRGEKKKWRRRNLLGQGHLLL